MARPHWGPIRLGLVSIATPAAVRRYYGVVCSTTRVGTMTVGAPLRGGLLDGDH